MKILDLSFLQACLGPLNHIRYSSYTEDLLFTFSNSTKKRQSMYGSAPNGRCYFIFFITTHPCGGGCWCLSLMPSYDGKKVSWKHCHGDKSARPWSIHISLTRHFYIRIYHYASYNSAKKLLYKKVGLQQMWLSCQNNLKNLMNNDK